MKSFISGILQSVGKIFEVAFEAAVSLHPAGTFL
jgi:hypothetical protein